MIRNALLLLFFSIPLVCSATDRKPWIGSEHEAEIRASLLYQNYSSIAASHHRECESDDTESYSSSSDHHSFKETQNDVFLSFSAAYPLWRFCGEFEATVACTRHQSHCWDNFRITGRYQWLSEIRGASLSMVTGITATEPLSRALHDISSFHHGHVEGEAFLSIGKKYGCTCFKNYQFRWWNVAGIGTAEIGSPWIREDAAFEYIYCDVNHFRLFVNTLWGIGKKDLRPEHFKGYGNIKHRSVDVGIRYSFYTGCWGTLSAEYARRIYAHNFPRNANLFLFEYYLPFGSQPAVRY